MCTFNRSALQINADNGNDININDNWLIAGNYNYYHYNYDDDDDDDDDDYYYYYYYYYYYICCSACSPSVLKITSQGAQLMSNCSSHCNRTVEDIRVQQAMWGRQ